MRDISLVELLKSGAHFGHKTSRWNPRMKPFLFTVRNDIHIFDLEKTRKHLLKAAEFAAQIARAGGTILFIGTKRQARPIVQVQARACGMPYVNVRWLGGTFTNFKTIQKTIRKLEKLQELAASSDFEVRYTKKERLLMQREIDKLQKLFEGVKDMKKLPEAIFVTDVNHDDIPVKEAQKTGVKIIAIADSNSNPDGIDQVIPSNDDATQAIELVTRAVAEAILEARSQQVKELAPETTAVPTK
jgi:small subunit ribosomal protein S2